MPNTHTHARACARVHTRRRRRTRTYCAGCKVGASVSIGLNHCAGPLAYSGYSHLHQGWAHPSPLSHPQRDWAHLHSSPIRCTKSCCALHTAGAASGRYHARTFTPRRCTASPVGASPVPVSAIPAGQIGVPCPQWPSAMPTVAQCHAVRRDVPGAAFERRRPTAHPCACRTTYNVPPVQHGNVSVDTARTHVPSAPTDLILATLQSGMLLDVRPP